MRNFRKRVGRFVYLKSKANELERRQYFQESFTLSRKIQLQFP